jgi:hypothetical protein
MTTAVPQPSLTPTGFLIPTQSAVLAGVYTDWNTAFGGNLNPALNTPQGQLESSETAIILDANAQFIALANSMDPAFATGCMQDAIGRIYYQTRIAAVATVVTATCSGATGTVIPIGAQALDTNGVIYIATQTGTIPSGGSVAINFACSTTGPIACPIGFLNTIYASIPGWDSITNAAAGVMGNNVESRAAFETRRAASVAINAQGTLPAIIGAIFALPGVIDAYAIQNTLNVTSGAVVTGSISGTTLIVSSSPAVVGTIAVGMTITGTGIPDSITVQALGTGTGGAGTYILNKSPGAIGLEVLTISWGAVPLVANSIYIAVYGGVSQAIGQAIWNKMSPGCNMNGNTSVTVSDTGSGYSIPIPTYTVTFEIPATVPVLFAISLQNNAQVPANAAALVQAAVTQSFNGLDGLPRARIGSWIFASRFYVNIAALGTWVNIYSIQLGVAAATENATLMNINQMPVIGSIAVTFA